MVVAYSFYPRTWGQKQADFWVQDQPGLQSEFQDSQGYRETLSRKQTNKQKNIAMRTMAQYVFSSQEFHNRFQETFFWRLTSQSVELVTQILLGSVWRDVTPTQLRDSSQHHLLLDHTAHGHQGFLLFSCTPVFWLSVCLQEHAGSRGAGITVVSCHEGDGTRTQVL